MRETINFLLAGVGGQGTILASDVLVNVGLAAGYQAKQAEVHGMSQRGGSVTSFVRWGQVVYSPLVGAGEVDVFLAFEKAEALRNLNQLRRVRWPWSTWRKSNRSRSLPAVSLTRTMPFMHQKFSEVTQGVIYVDGEAIAQGLGNVKAANVVLLGALSALMEREGLTGPELSAGYLAQGDHSRVPPKYVELNRQAFNAGREVVNCKN